MYHSVHDLARRWDVSEPTIRRWLRQGIPGSLEPFGYSRLGRAIRWSDSQLEQIEAAMRRTGHGGFPQPARRRRRPAS
jgi:transposase-like protein